ncbi:MAG TPA: methyltransferase domain-containing protein [Acetobacteraceae bacterium]|nr:methyltransferase domain-containing protein [Acetobacteraceae bacterium]
MKASRERCFGSSVLRVAETIAYCRIPIHRLFDIGAGTGWLLDALEVLLPEAIDRFHAVELIPPPPPHRTRNPNYHVGTLADLDGPFDAGIYVEVIEHLTPATLRRLIADLASVSRPASLYFFNSGQPEFVEHEDAGYLEPHRRGHIVSYSLAGLARLFEPAGFRVIGLPGRHWAFLAEFGSSAPVDPDALIARLWQPVRENRAMLDAYRFGELIRSAGIESARAYQGGTPGPMPWRHYIGLGLRATLRRQRFV